MANGLMTLSFFFFFFFGGGGGGGGGMLCNWIGNEIHTNIAQVNFGMEE